MSSADAPFEWEFPEEHEDHMGFFEEQWEGHFAGTMNEVHGNTAQTGLANPGDQSSGGNGDLYAVVRVWIDDKHLSGPRQGLAYIHVSDPGLYAPIAESNLAENAAVETLFPTEDEEEIKRWKLIRRSACVQWGHDWANFSVKWQESVEQPVEFSTVVTKGPNVVNCKVEALANDNNGHRLLLVTMVTMKEGVETKVELWGKRLAGGNSYTRLTADEKDYCCFEEQKRML